MSVSKPISRVTHVVPHGRTSQVQNKQLVVGSEGYATTSPFLFLSEDWFAPPGGFEEHPHRGMQTVTFVLEGMLEHRDHTGAHGVLKAGDVQWMTAGHGVLHSEMPKGPVHTLQLWLNLPAKMKMIPARYQDQRFDETPVRNLDAGLVRVYAGQSGEVKHGHGSDWPMWLLEFVFHRPGLLEQAVPADHRGFLYMIAGRAQLAGRAVQAGDVAWFEPGAGGALAIAPQAKCRALLFSGPPIDEPVVAYGPFVMNTKQEIEQAFMDYQAGRLVA